MSAAAEKPILAFAGFVLDVRKRSLLGPDGMAIDISSRAFETLHFLVSHPHELVDKQRLMAAVWPNRIVEDNNLNQQISALRKLLGEAPGEHRFIVTVTGLGYRFVQDVAQLALAIQHVDRDENQAQFDCGDPEVDYFDAICQKERDAIAAVQSASLQRVRELIAPGFEITKCERRHPAIRLHLIERCAIGAPEQGKIKE